MGMHSQRSPFLKGHDTIEARYSDRFLASQASVGTKWGPRFGRKFSRCAFAGHAFRLEKLNNLGIEGA